LQDLRGHLRARPIRWLAIGVAVATSAGCAGPGARNFATGTNLSAIGNHKAAVTYLRSALDQEPENPRYALALKDATNQAVDGLIDDADRKLRAGDLLGAREAVQAADSYDSTSDRVDATSARVAQAITARISLASDLADSLGRNQTATLGHTALLRAQAAALDPANPALVERYADAINDLRELQTPRVRHACQGDRSLCDHLEDIVRKVSRENELAVSPTQPGECTPRPPWDLLSVEIEVSELDVRIGAVGDPRQTSSRALVGYAEEVNSEFVAARVEYEQATSVLAFQQGAYAANPNAYNSGALIGARIRYNVATARLNDTPMTTSIPQYESYTFKEYHFGGQAQVAARVKVREHVQGSLIVDEAVIGAADRRDLIRLGVHPNDANGFSNTQVNPPNRDDLASEALRDLVDGVTQRLQTTLSTAIHDLSNQLKQDVPGLAFELGAWDALAEVDFEPSGRHLNLDAFLNTNLLKELPPAAPQSGMLCVARADNAIGRKNPEPTPARIAGIARPMANAIELGAGGREEIIARCQPAVAFIESDAGAGSGFFVADGGLLVTNEHVIAGSSNLVVHTADGRAHLASVVRTDPSTDLAILRIPESYPFLTLVSAAAVRVGADVIAIGAPEGFRLTATRGIVSQLRMPDRTLFIQHDAAINHGSSGGPLLNVDGGVIGVNTLKMFGGEGLGFAVSSGSVDALLRSSGL
jgi:S1-C subfamily serine protease